MVSIRYTCKKKDCQKSFFFKIIEKRFSCSYFWSSFLSAAPNFTALNRLRDALMQVFVAAYSILSLRSLHLSQPLQPPHSLRPKNLDRHECLSPQPHYRPRCVLGVFCTGAGQRSAHMSRTGVKEIERSSHGGSAL